jgi:hypothetical protein
MILALTPFPYTQFLKQQRTREKSTYTFPLAPPGPEPFFFFIATKSQRP